MQGILEAGHIPAGMEHFHASGGSQLETIFRWIDDCDLLFLIMGGRYGSVEQESGKSFVQLEYEYALSKNIPCCTIILTENYLQRKIKDCGDYRKIMEQEQTEKYITFKSMLKSNKMVKLINSLNEIILAITSSISDYEKDTTIAGWIKGNQLNSNLTIFNLDDLLSFAKKILLECAYRQGDFNFFPEIINTQLDELNIILMRHTYCDFVQRTITIEILDNETIRVQTSLFASYINADHNFYFRIYTQMNEQQINSFHVELLQIDGHDYTKEVQINQLPIKNGSYFNYEISSNFFYPENPSFDISYDSSYECPISDFYQAFRLEYPTRNFTVSATILNNSSVKYRLIGSKFSALFNSATCNEKNMPKEKYINDQICNFYFPKWSMPGTGYTLCIKKLN